MRIVATTSLPAVDRPNADRLNTARSCQQKVIIQYPYLGREVTWFLVLEAMQAVSKNPTPRQSDILLRCQYQLVHLIYHLPILAKTQQGRFLFFGLFFRQASCMFRLVLVPQYVTFIVPVISSHPLQGSQTMILPPWQQYFIMAQLPCTLL